MAADTVSFMATAIVFTMTGATLATWAVDIVAKMPAVTLA